MGVRGLTTFIKNHEKKYLKSHKLHSCTVLLDGNSVASNLFIWSNIESAFGGDYDKYAKYVKEFFKVLQKCNINPLVVFDGGYEQRKLKTVYSRMRDKFKSARCAQPQSGSLNFPLFMRIVFREVLVELNIPFAQSDFEADDELAALARQLQCPVLSYDSDFYIYDVLYIPLPTLSLEPVSITNKRDSDNESSYYLDCKIYSVDFLINSFGGLDKTMLPLLAALLGNDYIKRSDFKAFYANLKIPKGKTSPLQRRIKAVIEWLRNETFESAITKILSRIKKSSRRRIMRQIRKIVNGYVQCSSFLSEYLAISSDKETTNQLMSGKIDSDILNVIEKIDKNVENYSSMEYVDDVSNNVDDDIDLSEDDNLSDTNTDQSDGFSKETGIDIDDEIQSISKQDKSGATEGTTFPYWLIDYARKGKIQSCVIDILSLKQYFFPPQVEDFSLPPSHFISLKYLNAIVGLLLGNSDTLVRYWTRDGSRLDWYTVEPIYETISLKFPQCENILDISEAKRKSALLEVAEINVDISVLPEEWHLFIITVIFWLKNMKQPCPSECHLHTMVMCLVAIFTIDKKIGMYRNKQFFMRKYKNVLNKLKQSRTWEKTSGKQSDQCIDGTEISNNETLNPKYDLAKVSREDCILIFEEILPYHHLSEQIKANPKIFSISTVHAFAQFQSCLFHVMILNSLLGFPFKETNVSHLYSGTFIYNMFSNLSRRKNIKAYIETLFQPASSLIILYNNLIQFLEGGLTGVELYKKPTKQSKKKKKTDYKLRNDNILSLHNVEDDDDDDFIDVNNRFAGLTINLKL